MVADLKKKINNTLMSCHVEAGIKLLRYLNILNNTAFEHIYFSYKRSTDYNSNSLKILNLK